ncbi:MAG TPA: plastocyanin/azurin family copper-binding protein [Thermoleophilaceae bacterium]|nr:plastocyanin/azurin family copper-binding protein [Thermoleophilaceae bacterium]
MRKPVVVALIPLALAGASLPAAASRPDAQAAAKKKVKVGDLFFRKAKITIQSGDTVRWTWVGELPHDVTVKKGPRKFHSKTKTSGTYRKTIRKRGSYRYICSVHPDDMKGRIVVK